MPLKLTITSFQRLSPDQEATKILDRGSISIGRAAQNDWVLQDPERILSKNHCTVHYQDGAYFLTDLSANGTFLNDSDQRIARNQTIPLQNGDRFTLGEYEIEATVIAGAAKPEEPEPEQPLTDIIPALHVLPTGGDDGGPAVPAQPPFTDLLAEEQEHPRAIPSLPPPGKGAAVTEPPPDLLAPDRAFFEPPDLHPEAPPPPVSQPGPVESLPPVPPCAEPEPPVQTIAEIVTPAPTTAEPAKPAEMLIPDDWWLAPPAPPPANEPPPPAQPAWIEPPPLEPPIARRPAPAGVEPAELDAGALMRAFLESAGLPGVRLTVEQTLGIMANLGAIFRETVQGLTDILRARGDVKGEFRLDRTAIGPMENNPLKTPPGQPPLGLEEIMTLLLIRQKDAYMLPVQAVREGFNDIKAHQLAVMAGIQAALNRLLERFDPHNLETRLQQTVLDSILPASRKAKYWDLFTTEYEAIAREAEDDFNELFGDEFARAYEERLGGRPTPRS